ncbi:hypothetical protein VB735_12425 [Halotia wernerae UHCC 0503]|nr:hypothetical protein [Halotia wernerae UHCC 0503]
MHMSIVDQKLQIEFTWKEQLLAVRWQKVWQIPLTHIEQVTTAKPQSNWKDLRAPGTSIPGVIKAGTYYTNRGKEFWYADRQTNYFTIELQDESYKRIILTIENNESWRQKLTSF